MKHYFLPRKTLFLWQIRAVMLFLLLTAFTLLLSLPLIYTLSVLGVILLAAIFTLFWYLPRFVKSCTINFTDGVVIIRRGVFFEKIHIFPSAKLIYTQTLTSPLANAFNLSALSLKAARSRLIIPEMNRLDAELLAWEIKTESNL